MKRAKVDCRPSDRVEDVSKTPKKPLGRALTDESELDDEELERITGGAGASGKQDVDDNWARIVDDHSKEIPASSTDEDHRSRRGPPGAKEP